MNSRFRAATLGAIAALAVAAPGRASAQLSLTSATEQHWYLLVDTLGNVVSQQPLELFRSFRNGFAVAGPGSYQRAWIDPTGKRLTTEAYYELSDFNDQGLAMACRRGGPAFVVDRAGKEVRKIEAPASGMLKRRASVVGCMRNAPYAFTGEKYGEKGLLDLNGRELFKPTYPWITEFSEGLAAVSPKERDDIGWIDTTGALVIATRFKRAKTIDFTGDDWYLRGEFHDGRAAIREGNVEGFINRRGEVVIAPKYTATGDFHDGFARVRLPGDTMSASWAFIDTTGKQASTAFTYAHDFHNGAARARMKDGRDVLVAKDMTLVPRVVGPFAGDMGDNGMIAVKRPEGVTYLRRDGSVAIPASKFSAYANVGYEFTAGRTVVEKPSATSGPKVAMVWYEIRQSGQPGSNSRQFQILYAIVEAPERSRAQDLEDEVKNKPRNSLAVTIATGAYPLPAGQREPDMDDILSRSAAKPRYTKDASGHITWVDTVDPRYLGRFKMQ